MNKKKRKANIVLILGFVGMMAALLTSISDLILLGRPNSGYSFFMLGTESMADLAQWKITVGVFLGIIALPFQMAGLIAVYYGLKQAGRVMPLLVLFANAHALIMGVAFHVSYAFIGTGWRLYYEAGPGNSITAEIVNKFNFYWKLIILIMLTEIFFSSVVYITLILKGNTLYPKWMAICNPLCVILFMLPLMLLLPAPVGGFIAPAYLNLSAMVYFGISTALIYKRLGESQSKV